MHFVLHCPKYSNLRETLFQKILAVSKGKWNLQNLGGHSSFLILVNGTGDSFQMLVFQEFQTFLFNAFKLRGT